VITSALLSLLGALLDAIASVLPSVEDLPWSGATTSISNWLESVGGMAGPFDHWIPLAEIFDVMDWMVTYYLPVVVTYLTVRWVYAHLPVVGKG